MFTEIQLIVFCESKLISGDLNGLRDASWAILATCCVARTNDLCTAKISDFTVSLCHVTSGKCRVSFNHHRENSTTFNRTIICNIDNDLYVNVLKAYIRRFDGIKGDMGFWSNIIHNSNGIVKLTQVGRIELAKTASNIASELGFPTFGMYKQHAFRQLGYRKLAAMHVSTTVLMRIGNSTNNVAISDDQISRFSSRLATAQIVLLIK